MASASPAVQPHDDESEWLASVKKPRTGLVVQLYSECCANILFTTFCNTVYQQRHNASIRKPSTCSGGLRSGQYRTEPCEKYYKFGRTLGKGSFATVKLATCNSDGSRWAVKIIDKHALNSDDKEALQLECDTMMKVDHDNIVKLKEIFDNDKKFYMVLEICSGGELFDRIVEVEHYSEKVSEPASQSRRKNWY